MSCTLRPSLTCPGVPCLQCKPEQVQAVQSASSEPTSPTKRDRLQYEVGDVVTVLDKRYAWPARWLAERRGTVEMWDWGHW